MNVAHDLVLRNPWLAELNKKYPDHFISKGLNPEHFIVSHELEKRFAEIYGDIQAGKPLSFGDVIGRALSFYVSTDAIDNDSRNIIDNNQAIKPKPKTIDKKAVKPKPIVSPQAKAKVENIIKESQLDINMINTISDRLTLLFISNLM